MLERIENVLDQRETRPAAYERISLEANQQQFCWRDSAQRYMSELYA